jgi:hypothetical protein
MSAFFAKYLTQQGLFNTNTGQYEWGNKLKISKPSTTKTLPVPIELVNELIHPSKIKIAQREALMWNSPQQEAIAYGNVIHEIAASLYTADDLPSALQKAIESGLIAQNQLQQVSQTLTQLLQHPEVAEAFAAGNKVWNEQAILQPSATVVKPDRIVQLPSGAVILLDYKTGAPKPQHEKQLAEYENVLVKMGFVVSKKLVVYLGETPNVIHL